MKHFRIATIVFALTAIAFSSRPCFADDPNDINAQLAALRNRFEQRYPQIHALKQKGIVGETSHGYLDFVKDKDDSASALVNQENSDRRELYALIAKKENTTPEKVAERNARRNFDRAKPGEFLQSADGKWQQKQANSK